MILPGSTIGLLGGGQLGRYFTLAARDAGYNVIVLDPGANCPAGQVANAHINANYDDDNALAQLAEQSDVITLEFENIPVHAIQQLSKSLSVFPDARAIAIAQDRIAEKKFFKECDIQVADYKVIEEAVDCQQVPADFFPAIMKTARFGYDGKGQIVVNNAVECEAAFQQLGQVAVVLEKKIAIALEVSVILGRNATGDIKEFPIAENEHRQGILHRTVVPANVSAAVCEQAIKTARSVITGLEYVGVLAVEFFIDDQGRLLVNEMAPRPHNSGHYTLDACVKSQFDMQLHAVAGLPLPDVRLHSAVAMVNVLGDCWGDSQPNWTAVLAEGNHNLHLYGKQQPNKGRKMGHFCITHSDILSSQQLVALSETIWENLHAE